MATAKADTGHGATLTFGTTTFAGLIRGIPANLTKTLQVVNISNLATSGQQETMPGDLEELGEVDVDILFAAVTGLPVTGTVETITITFPLQASGATTAANIAGTAFITMIGYPALQTNGEMLAKVKFKYDGATGPTFTAAS
jgi:lysozyme family protein